MKFSFVGFVFEEVQPMINKMRLLLTKIDNLGKIVLIRAPYVMV
jgi:hypothetical protein